MDFKEEKKSVEQAMKKMVKQVSSAQTDLSRLEIEDYDLEAKRALVLSAYQDIKERKRYAFWIFLMVLVWLMSIVGIIITCGMGLLVISDPVLLGLIGATTVNVTTFFVIVTKYLFPSNNLKSGGS